MNKIIVSALLSFASTFSHAESTTDIVCTYAPSQSEVVKNISASAGGAGATAVAITQATGLTAVAHSSGAYIFTGSSGYVAGTLGGAAAAPVIIGVSIIVGTAAGTVELLCTPQNHPEFTARVVEASEEFIRRSKNHLYAASEKISTAKQNAKPIIFKATVVLKDNATNVFNYAYRAAINSELK
jgi:Na+/phosphate symporter